MTRPKRIFAEMLAAAQGGGGVDIDEICDRLSLADIMYEIKKLEKETEAESAAAEIAAAEAEAVEDVAAAVASKKTHAAAPPPVAPPTEEHKIEDFWTRISGE